MPVESLKDKKKKATAKTPLKTGSFPIVAIGASSGGLEAVSDLLKFLPSDTGMAFIIIQHLSRDFKSILTQLLAKTTNMVVQEIEDMDLMEPNNVYVIPHDKEIEVTNGHIQLLPRPKSGTTNLSIDVLFTSLAETHHEGSIGIVLSGNGSDGTLGLKAIKQEGGITFAQDDSAKYGSMPDSAIKEGVADFVLSPREIALELSHISKYMHKEKKLLRPGSESKVEDNDPDLKVILQMLYKASGVDFSNYKMNTIKRRILRRMFLYKLPRLGKYVDFLKTTETEIDILYNDLLINVTEFFREPETFEYLKSTILPKLLKNKAPEAKLRIWVTACSTGQEAYSIAMLLAEIMGNNFQGQQIQIFASDLSDHTIKKARKGEYTKHEIQGVSAARLERFFHYSGGNYQITKTVRDMCTFAPHNILSDPPFSRIDLVTCCNMLIYFDTGIHKRIFKTFHFSLNPGGYLMLGKSETVGASPLFKSVSTKFKVYSKTEGPRSLPVLVPGITKGRFGKSPVSPKAAEDTSDTISSILFSRYMPAYVVINHSTEISQFKGNTAKYLEHTTGKASLNILSMARPEISFELRDAINKCIETGLEIHTPDIEIKNGLLINTISLDVIPLPPDGGEPMLLVIFTDQAATSRVLDTADEENNLHKDSSNIKKLKDRIATLQTELIQVKEEKERSNQILQAANEEILSSNEEFQSMNEELDSSKEEIESANEELITTNQELQTRNEQLAEAYDLSEAIVSTLHEPMLILDKYLSIKSCNKAFCKTFMVQQSDMEGKLLYEPGNRRWDIPGLRQLLENTIQKDNYFYDYEITHVFPDIGRKTMLLNARRIVQKVQNEQLILLAFTDITASTRKRQTEKRELEEIINERTVALEDSFKDLEEKNLALRKMNKELETFTYISSHDLQEPLRKIKNFASLLMVEEHAALSAKGKGYLQRMQVSVVRMQLLIKDLLAYAGVKNNGSGFKKVKLDAIIHNVLADLSESISEKNATVTVNAACSSKIILFQFRLLIQNLITNALKFSNDKEVCTINIKCVMALGSKLDNPELIDDIKYCHITVSDNGIGFDQKYGERIFEVFQRLHEYDDYIGTGMGLAICKRIVENHNGIITATGILNKGAQFDIYIPSA